ncbi:hypothetical protein Shyd_75690 [Streptomyces hydrogenans]|uniref:Secreted protein n=1 Tax=Streptomyces hydrogenans TaxID=1873719 RepID=A0ABQ3PMD9_9ACTN|nr:hypothetical protein GCM10018784_05880 [Streptomyces hydrogenans]GHI26198.1 hypothetical protein Shyd_75690 [Streptomyces hydrogenans]
MWNRTTRLVTAATAAAAGHRNAETHHGGGLGLCQRALVLTPVLRRRTRPAVSETAPRRLLRAGHSWGTRIGLLSADRYLPYGLVRERRAASLNRPRTALAAPAEKSHWVALTGA